MNTIETIRAEIERRITENTFGAKMELIDLLSFLDTLESEHLADERKMIEPEKKEGRTDCSPQGEVPNDSLATQSYEKKPNNHEEHVPKIKKTGTQGLDEVATKLYPDVWFPQPADGLVQSRQKERNAFKAGAAWMKKQLNP